MTIRNFSPKLIIPVLLLALGIYPLTKVVQNATFSLSQAAEATAIIPNPGIIVPTLTTTDIAKLRLYNTLRQKLPVYQAKFNLHEDLSKSGIAVSLYPPYPDARVAFSAWMQSNGYSELTQDFFTFLAEGAVTPTPRLSPTPTVSLVPTSAPTPSVAVVPTSGQQVSALYPEADAYVHASYSSRNYGTSSTLNSDSDPVKVSYFKFNLAALAGRPVSSAVFKIKISDSSNSRNQVLSVSDTAWSETAINYSNKPALGSVLATFTATTAYVWKDIDITQLVNNNLGKKVSFAINSLGSDNLGFSSREVSGSSPYIALAYGSSPSPTAVPGHTIGPSTVPLLPPSPTAKPASSPVPYISPGTISTLTLVPEADAFVDGTYANSNYGADTALQVDGDPVNIAYLRFNLAPLSGRVIESATLSFLVSDTSYSTQSIKRVSSVTWDETLINYQNRPALGTVIASVSNAHSGSQPSIDITAAVKEKLGQKLSIGIDSTGDDGLDFYSREYSGTKPTLVIKYSSSGTSVSPSPTPAVAALNTLNLSPEADTFVDDSYPDSNYGADTALQVDGDPVDIAYLRFNLAPLAGRVVESATLKFLVSDTSYSTQSIKRVSSVTWGESSTTYQNRPALGTVINSITNGHAGNVASVDITAAVKEKLGQQLSIGIDSAGDDGLDFYSREYSGTKPTLVIKYY